MSRIFKSVCVDKEPMVIEREPLLRIVPPPEAAATAEEPGELAAMPLPTVGESIVREAVAEADRLLAAAREEAKAVLAEAQARAETMRQVAYDEGFRQGHGEGLAQGEAAGLQQARGAVDEAVERAQRIVAMAEEQGREALQAAERDMVELALAAAGKVLARLVSEDEAAVLPIIRAALDKVREQEQITVRVHPDDYEMVLAARPELAAILTRSNALAVAADAGLKKGDCVVETPFGSVDARVDSQLALVRAALRDLLP